MPPFESRKYRKEGNEIQKSENIENKKSILDEIKSIFYGF